MRLGSHKLLRFTALTLILMSGCVSFGNFGFTFRDRNPLSIQVLNLYSQRDRTDSDRPRLSGDWLFRRERLEGLSQIVLKSKPDLMFFQEAMAKRDTNVDSDAKILQAGPLAGYEWKQTPVQQYADTDEIEYIATAITAPHSFDQNEKETLIWKLSSDGILAFYSIIFENEPIGVFHVKMPTDSDGIDWYQVLAEHIETFFQEKENLCKRRWIAVGQFSGEPSEERYQNFLSDLKLKDTSTGFCENTKKCTLVNGKLPALMTPKTILGTRPERILVPEESYIFESSRILKESFHSEALEQIYHLEEAWPTVRMGWQTQVRLPRCTL